MTSRTRIFLIGGFMGLAILLMAYAGWSRWMTGTWSDRDVVVDLHPGMSGADLLPSLTEQLRWKLDAVRYCTAEAGLRLQRGVRRQR